jgi:hypothetical protein
VNFELRDVRVELVEEVIQCIREARCVTEVEFQQEMVRDGSDFSGNIVHGNVS